MNLKGMCRTCLCSGGAMFPLFGADAELMLTESLTAVEVLEMFTSVQVSNEDHMPDHICVTCVNEIQRAYLFKLKCQKSETIIHQLKDVKINIKRLKAFPNRFESERQSNIKLTNIKGELVEIENINDHRVIKINANVSGTELKHNQIEPNLECVKVENAPHIKVTFKNEPELDIEDIDSAKNDEELLCLHCGEDCQSVSIFLGHVITEHIENTLCKICNKEFEGTQFLHSVEHIPPIYLNESLNKIRYDQGQEGIKQKENVASNGKYCQHCFNHFADLKLLKLHVIVKHSKPEFRCSICTKIFTHKRDYNKHRKQHNRRVQCKICSKTLSSRNYLGQHMRIHTDEKPFQCKLCPKKFRLCQLLSGHMETKHTNKLPDGKPRHQCTICLKVLGSSSHRVKHMRLHTGEKPFQCKLCPEKFRLSESRRSHMDMKHGNELYDVKPRYQCNICSKICGCKSHLTSHMRSHTGEKPYQCKLCWENFRSSQSLDSHIGKKHMNELPDWQPKFKCSVCSKIFARKANLLVHSRIHSGINPFECKMCPEKFRLKKTLRGHVQTKHINELSDCKPKYQCNVCLKNFACKSNLTTHMRIHTAPKPFECKLCSERFRYKHLMRVHIETKHRNEFSDCKTKYQCTICSKMFIYGRSLKTHLKSKHALPVNR